MTGDDRCDGVPVGTGKTGRPGVVLAPGLTGLTGAPGETIDP